MILQVAEENGLEVMDQLSELNPASGSLNPAVASKSRDSKEDELDRRYDITNPNLTKTLQSLSHCHLVADLLFFLLILP